jgi:glycine/D-amino acid oxidase-like deaminating enzyme
MKNYDFLIAGGGVMGLTTSIVLRKRNFTVALLNPGEIPHPLAASTDISKIVRMEYGSDEEYMDMAALCIEQWKDWNEQFSKALFHEIGFLLLVKQPLTPGAPDFENASYELLLKKGFRPERLNANDLKKRYPAFNSEVYVDGFLHPLGGYVESSKVITTLATEARRLGIKIFEHQTVECFNQEKRKIDSIKTREGSRFAAGHFVVCAGHFSHLLVPELQGVMKATGHPVFHLKPSNPVLFQYPHFTVFGADIAKTGWYGFPLHPTDGVVKIANHGPGVELHPENDPRIVTANDEANLRAFLKESLPSLANDPVVFTRRCLYADTPDGHFWIDRHPVFDNLTIGAGGSGHAMKMAPVLGEMIASAALGVAHRWSERYRWRHFGANTWSAEEARFKG